MTTAGNLSVQIRYQKLWVNFNYCFKQGIFQNQAYNFFVLYPGSFCTAAVSKMFVFLPRISCYSNVCEKFDFCFTDFRKTIACLHMTHTAQISADFVIFNLWKFTWEKGIDKRKVHNPVKQLNSAIFINITKDLQYILHPPKKCMKCYLLTK